MSYANDQIEAANRRALDLTYNTTIGVYEPSVSYSPGDGFDVSRPDPETDAPDATYEARSEESSADADRDEGGTTAEIDREIMVRDDTGQQWVGYGDSGEAAVHVRDTGDDTVYEIQTVTDAHDGRITLEAVEV